MGFGVSLSHIAHLEIKNSFLVQCSTVPTEFQCSTKAVVLKEISTTIISSLGNKFVGACACGACVFINIPAREKNQHVSNILNV